MGMRKLPFCDTVGLPEIIKPLNKPQSINDEPNRVCGYVSRRDLRRGVDAVGLPDHQYPILIDERTPSEAY